jgi:AraC-like DNA-binding protein
MGLRRHHFELRRAFPSLTRVGIAVEHFPAYHHPRRSVRITHDILYCSLLLSGSATHHLGGDRYGESAGSLSVVNYGIEHEIVTGRGAVEVFNIYLDPERHALPRLPPELASQLYRLLPVHARFSHRLNRLSRVSLPDPRRTAGWLHAIAAEQSGGDAASATALLALTQLLLVDLARAVAAQAGPIHAGVEEDPLMEAVRRRLDAGFADECFLADLAAGANLSPAHLCRRFARYAGCPPMLYLRNRRLHEAMLRLRDGGGRILDIALDCGFTDLAYFNRCFKAAAGCTPSAYRARFAG